VVEKILLGPGRKILLLGNEAIVRGALESGVQYASTYPGTPSSEVGDTYARIAKKAGIYFEYSTNEKVAFESASGAALSGLRSMVSMKHFGLNVAADILIPMVFIGVNGGMVVMVADDPNCWSSAQSEQDSRYYSRLAYIPMLEPSNPQEAKDFTKFAYELSEKYKLPVLLRMTTRVSHTKGVVKLDRIVRGRKKGKFVKDPSRYNNLPPHIMEMHQDLINKIELIRRQVSEKTKINFTLNKNSKSKLGIVTSGVSFNYVMEALEELNLKIPVLKLSLTYPLPTERIKKFIENLKSVFVVEELEPIVENEVRMLAKDVNPKLKILGKDYLPRVGEFKPETVLLAISRITGKKLTFNYVSHSRKLKKLNPPKRFPIMCPGCPHRATFYAVKKAVGKDVVFGGDIGCYILGIFPPYEMQDFILCMGASEGIIHGIKKVTGQKAIAFIGDSTFFHAGIPGLINMVYNKSNTLVIIMDNRITAMTGHQPHPGVGRTGMGETTDEIEIDKIVKACGVKHVKVIDPYNVKEMINTVKEFMKRNELSVIIAKRECQLLANRRKRKMGITTPKFEVDPKKAKKYTKVFREFACPAFYEDKGVFKINRDICVGCAVCTQIIPERAVHIQVMEK